MAGVALREPAFAAETLPNDSRQCIVVTNDSWDATRGRLFVCERGANEPWKKIGQVVPVVLGKSGMAWGRGLPVRLRQYMPIKYEGDNRAPAGVFRLLSSFGYAAENPGTKMPYRALNKEIVAVDDPKSRHYNQIVDQRKVRQDWKSAEHMILGDDRYKWGIVVGHNQKNEPGGGSCIFLHVWKTPDTLTTGCTATSEDQVLQLLRWLDPAKRPLLVQMPRSIYSKYRAGWGLPDA